MLYFVCKVYEQKVSIGEVMKTKKLQALMILMIVMACISCAAASFSEQAVRYAVEQEGKHMSLVQAKEDVGVLRACLAPTYGIVVKPEFTVASASICSMVPPAKMVPSLVQPDSTAIAASPRPEITTGSEEKR